MRFTVILLIVIGVINGAKAQTTPVAYRIGVSANLPYVNKFTDTFSARTGWGVWGNTEFDFGDHIRFTPTLAYNNFGYSQNYFNDSGSSQKRKITEHYLDAIAEINYLPSPRSNSTRINFGMGVSLLAGRATDQPDILGRNITIRTIENKQTFTPNFIAHLGINAPLSTHIELGLQYTISQPHKIFAQDISGRLGIFQIKFNYKILPTEKRIATDESEERERLSLFNKDSLIVVVRLKENARRIASLNKQGYYLEASELKQETLEDNTAIVEAFKEKFTLLPVYYFYDTDSKATLDKGFEGILLNEKLERDSSYRLPKKEYLIAELGRQFDEVSQTSGMYGLVILDGSFSNIPEPFPAFTSNFYGLLSTKDMIGKFQKRLYKYLKQ